jgi:hypothetical protein
VGPTRVTDSGISDIAIFSVASEELSLESNPWLYEELKRAGSNPNNFANIISNIIIAENTELGYTSLQNERLREIEKLTLTNWKGIKEFSQHYLYNATTANQGYNKGIVEGIFIKYQIL